MARITKYEAEYAAEKMAKAIYNERIKTAQDVMTKRNEEILERYLPLAVREAFENCPQFFQSGNYMYFKSKEGYTRQAMLGSYKNPAPHYYYPLTEEEQIEVRANYSNYKKLLDEQNRFEDKMIDACLALRTEKRIRETLPDAVKYFEFDKKEEEKCTTLVPLYTELNALLKQI